MWMNAIIIAKAFWPNYDTYSSVYAMLLTPRPDLRQSEGRLTKPSLKDQTVKMSPSSVACLFRLGGA